MFTPSSSRPSRSPFPPKDVTGIGHVYVWCFLGALVIVLQLIGSEQASGHRQIVHGNDSLTHRDLAFLLPPATSISSSQPAEEEESDVEGGKQAAETATTTASTRPLYSTEIQPKEVTKQRPTLYLHVGPPKTAATMVQCALCANPQATEWLKQDNTVFLGTCPYQACGLTAPPPDFLPHRFSSFFTYLRNPSPENAPNRLGAVPIPLNYTVLETDLPEVSPRLLEGLNTAYNAGQNVVLIFEGSHRFNAEQIASLAKAILSQDDWNVQILVAYRRLYEWLPSRYTSMSNMQRQLATRSDNNNKVSEAKAAASWPTNKILPFDLDGDGLFHQFVAHIEEIRQHPTETVVRNFRRFFPSVHVINLHEIGDTPVLLHFLCTVLQAKHMCAAVTAAAAASPTYWNDTMVANGAVYLDYEILARAAYDADLLPPTVTRWTVVHALEEFVQQNNITLPRTCLSAKRLFKLERLSLALEKSLFQDRFTAEMKRDHAAGMQTLVDSGKFCSVDAEKVVETWSTTFANLQFQ